MARKKDLHPIFPKTPETSPGADAARARIQTVTAYKTSRGHFFESWDEALKEQIEIDEIRAGMGFLPWEYCECGCHGHELKVGKNCYYWCFIQLEPSRRYHLHTNHGFTGQKLGVFKTWREVDDALAPIIKATVESFSRDSEDVMELVKSWEAQRAISNRY